MLKNYLKTALRNLTRFKVYSAINIAGLAVGTACCIAIMLFVKDELSYDSYNKNADRIYRPTVLATLNGHDINGAFSPAPMGPVCYHDIPEVETYARLHMEGGHQIKYKGNVYNEDRFYWADSTFFDVFTFQFLAGDKKNALSQPNTVVLTESMARKYFENENPVDKSLTLDKTNDYVVTGVIKDVPQNSHFYFDFLGSLTTLEDSRNTSWLSNNYITYFLLKKGTDPAVFERKLNEEYSKYAGPQLKAATGISIEQFMSKGNRYGFVLQPLSSIHLHSNLNYEIEQNGNISYVYIFSAIALAILLIACINFINLSTARSEKRAKEVGVRKTLGSIRSHLIGQFLAESILMSTIAVTIAVGIVEVLLPVFNELAGKKMSLNLLGNPLNILLLFCLAIAVGVIAGSYPAFYLSAFRPIDVLKSDSKRKRSKSLLRNGLVIFQFTISIILFIGTLVIYSQLRFVQSKDLGFDKEEVLVINRADDLGNRMDSFINELKSNSNIIGITNSNCIPGNQHGDTGCWLEGTGAEHLESTRIILSDYDFSSTFHLQMAEGRFFSKEHPSDTDAVVLNQEAVRTFGVKDIVGRYLVIPGMPASNTKKAKIIGVIKDFNYQSLHDPIRPLFIRLLSSRGMIGSLITVRLKPGNHLNTISFIENTWKNYSGGEEFSFNFLDQNLQKLYDSDLRTSKIAGTFSIIAIFIACLGLLGLAAFIIERRMKEIGIRKVLGASSLEVLVLLSKDFVKWVLAANIIAFPVAYYIMSNWLNNFAYRTEIHLWIFIVSGALALLIALITVSSQAIKAAAANPVKSLRYE